jgi:prepilin-type processing-associated H-X9-DG protein
MLVVIVIIGGLLVLLLPGIQAARECARRFQCAHQLSQLITAVHNYELAFDAYPAGTLEKKGPIQNHAFGYHHSWITQLLPFMELQNEARMIDRRVGVYHKNNAEVRALLLQSLCCPSSPTAMGGYSSYAGVYDDNESPIDTDNHGVFFLNSRITFDDLSDGAAQTLFIGEKIIEPGDLGWMSGTRATLRNTGVPLNTTGATGMGSFNWAQSGIDTGGEDSEMFLYNGVMMPGGMGAEEGPGPATKPKTGAGKADAEETPEPERQPPGPGPVLPIGGFGAPHTGGCQFAFGDGRVALLSESIALQVLQQLGHRSDGKLLSSGSYQP